MRRTAWPGPHYSTLSRRQRDLVVTIPYRPLGGPLHLVIDSTGRSVLGERLAARDPACQVAEVQIRCATLNTFNRLGMPSTVALT